MNATLLKPPDRDGWGLALMTDWTSPSTATLARINDPRASQYWDKGRRSLVWDYIAVCRPGTLWGDQPPKLLGHGGPVVRVAGDVKTALDQSARTAVGPEACSDCDFLSEHGVKR